ncbi:unnamed protein product [Protopolystoma xenopodis]|uniref:Uncharacterized protein n=1 Tax=Protopolystoma xenopodis TaxID=117903 RepID=A0A448WHM6_9PLAT|nr:unnamed protein product [Protopolystoma xenopodis]
MSFGGFVDNEGQASRINPLVNKHRQIVREEYEQKSGYPDEDDEFDDGQADEEDESPEGDEEEEEEEEDEEDEEEMACAGYSGMALPRRSMEGEDGDKEDEEDEEDEEEAEEWEAIRQETERQAKAQMEKARTSKVAFAVRTNVSFDGALEADCPVPGRAVSFQVSAVILIKEEDITVEGD